MKKLILLFFLPLSFLFNSASAQSLIGGEWRSYLEVANNPNGMFYYLKFQTESEMTFKLTMRYEQNNITLDYAFIFSGRYEYLGDEINLALDKESCKAVLEDVTFTDADERYYMRNPNERAAKVKEVEALLEGQKEQVVNVVPPFMTYKVIDFSDNLLMTKLNGTESFTFVRSR